VPEDAEALKGRVRRHCQARLERYKIPAVIDVVAEEHHGARFKKLRNRTSIGPRSIADAARRSGRA